MDFKDWLVNGAESLGGAVGKASKIVWDNAVDAARTADQVASSFVTSFVNASKDPSALHDERTESRETVEPIKGRIEPNLSEQEKRPSVTTQASLNVSEIKKPAKPLCKWKNCFYERLPGQDFCAHHERENEQFRARHCGNKRRHLTLEEAQLEASDLSIKQNLNFVAYSCRVCNFHHVGRTNVG